MSEEIAEQEFTESELSGEEEAPTETPEEKAEETPGEKTAAPKETETPEEKPEEKPAEKMVPLAALKEERGKLREMRTRLAALEAKSVEPKRDVSELIGEDPEEAIRVLNQKIESLEGNIARTDMENQIRSEVPDFFDKAPQMEDFLLEQGFDEDGVVGLIASAGRDAPKLFKVLDRAMSRTDEGKIRETLTAELTPKITAAVTKQIMEKFKIADPGTDIGNIPGSKGSGAIPVETEEEFASLSPADQQKWLSGEI